MGYPKNIYLMAYFPIHELEFHVIFFLEKTKISGTAEFLMETMDLQHSRTEVRLLLHLEEQDNSSDVEKQSAFGDSKLNNAMPQIKGGGMVQNSREDHICLTEYEAVHPTAVSENYFLSAMLMILTTTQPVCFKINNSANHVYTNHV